MDEWWTISHFKAPLSRHPSTINSWQLELQPRVYCIAIQLFLSNNDGQVRVGKWWADVWDAGRGWKKNAAWEVQQRCFCTGSFRKPSLENKDPDPAAFCGTLSVSHQILPSGMIWVYLLQISAEESIYSKAACVSKYLMSALMPVVPQVPTTSLLLQKCHYCLTVL